MRTNHKKLAAFETFNLKLACGFASMVLALFFLGLLFLVGFANSSFAQDAQPKMFASPGAAVAALFAATQQQNEQAVEQILGGGKQVTSSGDDVQDKLEREQFAQKYQEMHRLVREPDGNTVVLYIGAENWPFPIPLASKNSEWYFDSNAGQQEILFRRIGENEAAAIAVCEEFAIAANSSDVKKDSEDPITQFAQNLASAGSAETAKDAMPFHGYYFRIVAGNDSADANAHGKKNLKLVAYPAEYKSSGVKTFIVTHRGIVVEKDLGPETTTIAPQMNVRTGSNWHPAS